MEEKKPMTDEEVKEMNEQIKKLPPLSGDMAQDYTNLMLKELVVLGEVWENGYINKDGNGCSNILIANHIQMMQAQYDRLLHGVAMISGDGLGGAEQNKEQSKGV